MELNAGIPRVSIIILNWNGCKDTVECLESLYQVSYPYYDVILVDNGSKDGSLESIEKYAEGRMAVDSNFFEFSGDNKPIEVLEYTKEGSETGAQPGAAFAALPSNKKMILIKNDKNYGFAEGCNIGIRYAFAALQPEYILLLNNDTVVKNDFLKELVKAISSDETIGFAGPIVYYYNYEGRTDVISAAGIDLDKRKSADHRIGYKEVDRGQYNAVRNVDYLEGSCLLIAMVVLDKVGLLDSGYFAYWEEADLCMRGFDAGYKCVCVPTAKIWHKISSSVTRGVKLYYMTRNRFRFLKDHATRQEFYSFLIYFFIHQFLINIGVYLHRWDSESLYAFLRGVLHGLLPKGRFGTSKLDSKH